MAIALTAFAMLCPHPALAESPKSPVPAVANSTPGPVTGESLAARGRRLFLASCAHCHGADARGDDGPDLHDLEVSDHRIAVVITRGIKGEMPSFTKKHGEADVTALIAYLRSLDLPEAPAR